MNSSPRSTRNCYQFGPYRLDPSGRRLVRGDNAVALPSRALETLIVLVQHRGEVLDKKLLLDRVWPDTAVEENNLAQAIAAIRRALGEQLGGNAYIATVPGRGYSFVAEVREVPPGALVSVNVRGVPVVLLAMAVLAVAGGLGWIAVHRPYEAVRLAPLTGAGNEGEMSFSPDGGRIAYVWRPGEGKDGIYVKVIGAGDPVPLLLNGTAHSPAWSPDGRYIAYWRSPPGIYVMPAMGGAERLVARSNDTEYPGRRIGWAPDGKSLAVTEMDTETRFRGISIVSIETGQKRPYTRGPSELGDSAPAFSPDGTAIAYNPRWDSGASAICVSPLAGGECQQVTQRKEMASGFDWTADGREIVFTSPQDGFSTLRRVSASGGSSQPVSVAGYDVGAPVIARSGQAMAFVRQESTVNLWSADLNGTSPHRKLAHSLRRTTSPQFSPNGDTLMFVSNRSGWYEIWTSTVDGRRLNQLTSFGQDGLLVGTPRWSPDGGEVAFDARVGGNPDIYAVGSQGGSPRRVTTDQGEDVLPSYSRDGRWIYFTSNRTGRHEVWKVARLGGPETQITRNGGVAGLPSADGRFLYYMHPQRANSLWRVPVDGGTEEHVFEGAPNWKNRSWRSFWGWWTVIRGGIAYIEYDSGMTGTKWFLRRYDETTRAVRTLAELQSRPPLNVPCFGLSPDERTVVYGHVESRPNMVILAHGFR